MGNSIIVSLKNIYFSDPVIRKYVKKKLISTVVNGNPYYLFDKDVSFRHEPTSDDVTVYNVTCIYTEDGVEWWGSVEYKTRRGQFHIRKISCLRQCQLMCCKPCHR